ncbi:hypothetical protein QJS10_CPB18g01734 [Acorus calamus]|uniref:PGG domain-containing protein n=1 Tax=Acorus calamus TaxID=4465 RepID=A0AAV9CKZ7_ACOCL|nr:hypothetical protein QJS10_CPB18g01734 [Acorus calamus]
MAIELVPWSLSEILKEMRGSLLTVGALIVSATFQAGLNPPAANATSGKEHRQFMQKNTVAFINSVMFIVLVLASYGITDQQILNCFLGFVMGSMITTMVFLGWAYTSGSPGYPGMLANIIISVIIYACILTVFLIYVKLSGKKKKNVLTNDPASSAEATVEVEIGAMR